MPDFEEQIETWAEEQLRQYVDGLIDAPREPKEFNDPVWGTILIHPVELLLLDSPLFQRLRRVSQLGVVSYVYPSACHTRFEHTLGVIHNVTRLVVSINEHYAGNGEAVNQEDLVILRLAALCHDVGHGTLSHVSENAMHSFSQVEDVRLKFADDHGIEQAPLAEIVSYYIVGSESFRSLLVRVQQLVPNSGMPTVQETIDKVQRAIIGMPISDRLPLLHELISGPFDADKLDHMTRDAYMTGVPTVTDIQRLIQKVRAIEVGIKDLPQEIGEFVKAGESSYVVTGIAFSGGRTIDELIFGRTLHDDKVFRHHKVRAIESMIASIYQQLGSLDPRRVPMLPYLLDDSDFTNLTRERVHQLIPQSKSGSPNGALDVAVDLADRLKRRNLFVRAYAFSLGMPLDPYRADVDHFTGLEQLVRAITDNFEQRGRLVDSIVKEMQEAMRLLDPKLLRRYPDLKPYIWLDPFYSKPGGNNSARAYLVSVAPGPNRVMRFQDDYSETTRWATAYLLTRDAGYVFCPADLADYAYIATEKVLRRDYAIRTPTTMQTYAKRDGEKIDDLKSRLVDENYYAGIASDVRPLPRRLKQGDIPERVAKFCQKLQGYEGPVRGGVVDKKQSILSPERVTAWLRQFPERFGDEPLKVLEAIMFIGREEIIKCRTAFLNSPEGSRFSDALLCPFGDPKDSSAVTTYWANDATEKLNMKVATLSEAVVSEGAAIMFLDDFIGSGQQSISILESWLGEAQTTNLKERREPLSAQAVTTLRERPIAFLFAAGDHKGASRLRNRAAELGLDARVFVGDENVPRAFDDTASDIQLELRDFCRDVGEKLLNDPSDGRDDGWIKARALGYGNDGYLVLFGYNTPTQTLTCLWQEGTVDETPWVPLFPRRKKI